ncbi:hypothetical protein E8E14_010867 [Neopestalotiopsis sp. 37M]|nr:hypothetical protein E8E14_010867 [Neopestalotiopsis sp. 37M]
MTSTDPPFQSIKYLPTTEAYNRWAAVYDTDGNFLQALDDLEMRTLFPKFEAALQPTAGSRKLVDLGCGTGRNTVQLLGVENAAVVALDASPGMLAVAKRRLNDLVKAAEGQEATSLGYENLTLEVFDLLTCDSPPDIARQVDGVISTLVLEHIPLDTFFRHVSQMLKINGVLLLSNMHDDMGQISQAGFVDTETGEKVRPTSYAHTVESVIEEARKHGIVPIGADSTDSVGLMEKAVTEEIVPYLGPRSQKWSYKIAGAGKFEAIENSSERSQWHWALLDDMSSSNDTSYAGDGSNATEYLLSELLDVVKDKIATDESATDWDPITFAFTVPVGIFGILATLLAFVTIVQGIFAVSPGRRKSSRRVIGKWADKRWTTFQWGELRTTTFVTTPILRADSLYDAVQKRLEEVRRLWEHNRSGQHGEERFSIAGRALISRLKKDLASIWMDRNESRASNAAAATQASWLKLLIHFQLDNIDFDHQDLEITATDHIPDELRAVYAYTDIRTMVTLGAIAGASNLEPELGSSYPILIGTEIQIDFRQHPVLGMVAAFSRYGKQTKQTIDEEKFLLSSDLHNRAFMVALKHSNAEVEYNSPTTNDNGPNNDGTNGPASPAMHFISAHEDDRRDKRNSPNHHVRDIIHGSKINAGSCNISPMCSCSENLNRATSHHLLWMFVAKTPDDDPSLFPSSYLAIRKSLTTLCLQSRFWSGARANQSSNDLFAASDVVEMPELPRSFYDEFRDFGRRQHTDHDTVLQICLQFLSGKNDSVRRGQQLNLAAIRSLLRNLDSILGTVPKLVVGCRRMQLFLTTLILRAISCGIEDGSFRKSTPSPQGTSLMKDVHDVDGTIMKEHLDDLMQLDMFLSLGEVQCATKMPSNFHVATFTSELHAEARTILGRLQTVIEQCAAVAGSLPGKGKKDADIPARTAFEVIDDIIIWRTILIGVLFCSAPDNSKMFQSAVWNHIIPLL